VDDINGLSENKEEKVKILAIEVTKQESNSLDVVREIYRAATRLGVE
jgi:hypothetical protein